jgi:hypothetical protein
LGAVEQRTRIDSAMLSSVLREMQSDTAFPEAAPKPMQKVERAPTPGPINHSAYAPARLADVAPFAQSESAPTEALAQASQFEAMLAERDAQIAELKQAIAQLAQGAQSAPGGMPQEFYARLDALERKVGEQEQSVRQVLAMMIEWIEGQGRRAA